MTKLVVVHGENGESDNSKLILPVGGAEYIGIFNNTLSKVKNNFAPFKKAGVVVGNVMIDATSAAFKSLSKYVQTDVDDTANFTTFVVAKTAVVPNSTATSPYFIGNFQTPPKDGSSSALIQGAGMYIDQSGFVSTVGCRGNSVADKESAICAIQTQWTANEFHLVVGQVSGLNTRTWDKTKNLARNLLFTKPRLLAAGKLRVGSSFTDFTGDANVALVIHFPRALSDLEIDQVTTWIRSYMTAKGVTV